MMTGEENSTNIWLGGTLGAALNLDSAGFVTEGLGMFRVYRYTVLGLWG